jgi:hypothetical protein
VGYTVLVLGEERGVPFIELLRFRKESLEFRVDDLRDLRWKWLGELV